MYLGWDLSNVFEVLVIGPNMITVVLSRPFLPYEKGLTYVRVILWGITPLALILPL